MVSPGVRCRSPKAPRTRSSAILPEYGHALSEARFMFSKYSKLQFIMILTKRFSLLNPVAEGLSSDPDHMKRLCWCHRKATFCRGRHAQMRAMQRWSSFNAKVRSVLLNPSKLL